SYPSLQTGKATHEARDLWTATSPDHCKKSWFCYPQQYKEWVYSQFSVLLVRTGDDAHLSSPVSFQSLYDMKKALPVNRPDLGQDASENGMDVVRVNIDTALEFILDLIRREQETVPHVGLAAETEMAQQEKTCEDWVEGVMNHADRVGIDVNGFTWEAVRRVQAAKNGEAFHQYEVNPICDMIGPCPLHPSEMSHV
ncbi:hypothetical protein GGR57DRAFT_518184, partial [Xylariaceae sp. FL1272]